MHYLTAIGSVATAVLLTAVVANAGPYLASSWLRHSLSVPQCIDKARVALISNGWTVVGGLPNVSVIAEHALSTAQIQCEVSGIAFFAIASDGSGDQSRSNLATLISAFRN